VQEAARIDGYPDEHMAKHSLTLSNKLPSYKKQIAGR
jgi:hypothetical protein